MEMKLFRGMRASSMVVAAIVLQVIVLHRLDQFGVIDQIIPWDECAYIYVGISNAFAMENGFWRGVLYAHSPLSILPPTMAAFIAPNSDTAPYWINYVYLAGLFLFVNWALRNRRFSSVIAFVLILITTPFIFIFASHIKADFAGGMIFFVLLSLLFRPEDEPESPIWIPAVLSVLVIMSKPMAFYMPVLLAAVFVLSAANTCIISRSIHKQAIIRNVTLIFIVLIVYAALVIPNLGYFKAYIAQALSPLWANENPLIWKLQFYLPFVTSAAGSDDKYGFWGRNYVAYAVIVAGFIYAARSLKTWRPALFLAAVALIALIPITLSPQQQWSFGSQFAGAIVALVFYMFRVIQSARPAVVLNWVICIASVIVFSIPVARPQSWIDNEPKSMKQARDITYQFAAHMDPHDPKNSQNISIFFPFVGAIPAFDFGIRCFREFRKVPSLLAEPFTVDESVINGGLSQYAYIVMIDDGKKLPQYLESNRNVVENQNRIKASWNLEELLRLPYSDTYYTLYRVLSKKEAASP